jgi:hypothetical protein
MILAERDHAAADANLAAGAGAARIAVSNHGWWELPERVSRVNESEGERRERHEP